MCAGGRLWDVGRSTARTSAEPARTTRVGGWSGGWSRWRQRGLLGSQLWGSAQARDLSARIRWVLERQPATED